MKMHNLSKLTLAVLVAAQFLNAEVAHASSSKSFTQIIHTSNKEILNDPYFQVKSMSVRELTSDEAREIDENVPKISNRQINRMTNRVNSNLKLTLDPPGSGARPIIPSVGGFVPGPGDQVPVPPIGGVPGSPGVNGLDNVLMIIDKLIAVGQKITAIIKDGKSVVNNNPMAAISVLPRSELKDPVVHEMGGWTIPVSKRYKISFRNGFGSEVIGFVYSVSFQYNGSTNGRGKYLAGVRASARQIDATWGYDIDASSQLIQISNVGTQDNVVAGATIEMTYTVKNWAKSITTSNSFHVTGDGRFYKLD